MLDQLVQPAVILSASVSLFGGVALQRWLDRRAELRFGERRRVQVTARVRANLAAKAVARVLSESAPVIPASVARSWPESYGPERGLAPALPPPVPMIATEDTAFQAESAPSKQAAKPSETVLLMGASEQLREFTAYCRAERLGKNPETGRWERRGSHQQWFDDYVAWAKARSIIRLPSDVFLKAFADTAGVEKARGTRVRDASGEIVRTAKGSPIRPVFYTLTEVPLAAADKPQRRNSAAVRSERAGVKARDEARVAQIAALEGRGDPMETWAEAMHEISRRRIAA